MRILYVHNSADLYGASRSLLRLLRTLDRQQFEPLVVLPAEGDLAERLRALPVQVFILPSLSIITREVFHAWRRLLFFLPSIPISALALARLIRREHINLVHTNTAVILSSGLAAWLEGVPHFWHIRDSFQEFRSFWRVYELWIRFFSDRILAVSEAIAAQFRDRTKVSVLHNGFDPEEFALPDPGAGAAFREKYRLGDGLVVGCVGRIKLLRKGQEVLLAAAAWLKQNGVRAKILIVGAPYPGNEKHLARLQEIVRKEGLEDDVVFTGELADPRPAYAAMDILVLPSAQPEPFGGVVMEAMCMRLPVIATNIGGSVEQVADGESGWLVPPGDAAALADKLWALLSDPERRKRFGECGHRRVKERFALHETKTRIETFYKSLATRKRRPSHHRHEPFISTPAGMPPMKIGFYLADQNLSRDRSRGITGYTVALLTALSRRPNLHLSLKTSLSACSPEIAGASLSVLPFRTDSVGLRVIADQLHPLWNSDVVNLWHYPKGFLPAFLKPRRPVIGTVCDTYIQFFADHYPQYRSRWDYAYWLRMLRWSIARFDAIITISECSRRAIVELCERYRIQCPSITVTYLAVDWKPGRSVPQPKQDFVLHLASPEPNKQTTRLLKYWSCLARRKKGLPELKLVGNLTDEQSAIVSTIPRVSPLRPLPQEELGALMDSARALLLPSEIEGFGLPALEAYDAGTPVVYVRDTTVQEVLGAQTPGAFVLDDPDSFAAALDDVLSLSFEQVNATRHALAATYSWERCAQETVRVYEQFA